MLVMCLLLGLGGWHLYGQPPATPPQQNIGGTVKPFMHQKLENAKAILEALATEDYTSMAKNAQALSLLSLESGWNVLTTDEYLKQSSDFRRACGVIQAAAKEKNVDRAALGFVNLTVHCVECHKYVRKSALPAENDK